MQFSSSGRPAFARLQKWFYLEDLLLALQNSAAHLFGEHPFRATFPGSPHSQMTDIWLRANSLDQVGPHFGDAHDSVWYPSADVLPSAKRVVFDLMHFVQGTRLGGVLITKLPSGGEIATHVDAGWHARHYQKFVVAIQNRPGAVFRFPGFGDMSPSEGDCYWFDNAVPHGVVNRSDSDRVVMIVCIEADFAYFSKLFAKG